MSKFQRPAKQHPDPTGALQEAYEALIDITSSAAVAIVKWDRGDLAAAVRDLDKARERVNKTINKLEKVLWHTTGETDE